MLALATIGRQQILRSRDARARRTAVAFAAAALLGALLSVRPELLAVVIGSLVDAYLQVSVFVAVTLLLVAWADRALGLDLAGCLGRGSRLRLVVAALLGALPGCGGAVVVVTQYVAGRSTFGALAAVLTATMGDAAFLLLAREPVTGLALMLLGFGTGVVTGYATERLLPDWRSGGAQPASAATPVPHRPSLLRRLWLVLLGPGLLFAVLGAFQVDTSVVPLLDAAVVVTGVAGAGLCVLLWACGDHPAEGHTSGGIAADTAMVTVWVIAAFLAFELSVAAFAVDPGALLTGAWPVLPLVGALVGFLPGCGPQIVVASLYLSGTLPVSALVANAISNDGDALFPALALAPRAAIAASLVTAVPALLVGYGLHLAL